MYTTIYSYNLAESLKEKYLININKLLLINLASYFFTGIVSAASYVCLIPLFIVNVTGTSWNVKNTSLVNKMTRQIVNIRLKSEISDFKILNFTGYKKF